MLLRSCGFALKVTFLSLLSSSLSVSNPCIYFCLEDVFVHLRERLDDRRREKRALKEQYIQGLEKRLEESESRIVAADRELEAMRLKVARYFKINAPIVLFFSFVVHTC